MLCHTESYCRELSADINADSSRKIRYKIKGKGSARIACRYSVGKYAFAFAWEREEGAEIAMKKEKG
jgi:hypothetical protein